MAQPTEVCEKTITVPAYSFGSPAKPPCLLLEGSSNIYPYTLMDDIYTNREREDRSFRGLCLENRYIRVIVFPELGGHIYSAYDKIAKREMFYKNDVFKPGLILLRGAWCPFGVEFNFPCGHSVTTLCPVDSWIKENPDGSGSVFVGDVEKVSRMKWLVEIRVNPGEAAFRTVVRLMNGTEIARRYYFWANAAVPASDGLQFISPASEAKPSWSSTVQPFPVIKGSDTSWYRNHDHAVDLFTMNSTEDHFGYYDHDKEFGAAHVAPWFKVRGKKFFTWGTGPDGLVWSEILSDGAGPYVEIQNGLFPTQKDFGMLQPHTASMWKSIWYPVRGTGGFDCANEYAAVKIDSVREGGRTCCTFRICANRNRRNVRVRFRVPVKQGTYRTLYTRKCNMDVYNNIEGTFSFLGKPRNIEFKIIDSKGVHLLTYIHGKRKLPAGDHSTGGETCGGYGASLEALFHRGYSFERYNDLSRALKTYRQALEKDPLYSRALTEMGKIQIYMGRLEQAEENLRKALVRDSDNSDARYYRGTALKRLGKLDEAVREFQQLSLDSRFAALGYFKLGETAMLQADYIKASELFENALRYNPDDMYTEIMVAVSMRKRGRRRGPMRVLMSVMDKDPTDPMLHNEIYLLSGGRGNRAAKQKAGRDLDTVLRGDPQSCIELAVRYGNIGLIKDAVSVLERCTASYGSGNPFAALYLGYFLRKSGKTRDGNRMYRKATSMDQTYGFPFRSEAYSVLEDVLSVYPDDSAARYYLGNLLASRRRVEEAMKQWKKCEELGSANPMVYRNIGLVYCRAERKCRKAEEYYKKSIQIDPHDRELYWELDRVYTIMGWNRKRVALLRSRPPELADDMKTGICLADGCFHSGDFRETIRILLSRDYYPWEGGRSIRKLYMWSHLYLCEEYLEKGDCENALRMIEKAEEYPENIKKRPRKQRCRSVYRFYRGLVHERAGELKKARKEWVLGAQEEDYNWQLALTHYGIYRAKCLKKLGKHRKAVSLFNRIASACGHGKDTNSAHFMYMNGICALETGRFKKAEEYLKDSLKTVKGDIQTKKALTRLRRRDMQGRT